GRNEKIKGVIQLWKTPKDINYHQSPTICQEIRAFATPRYLEWHRTRGSSSLPSMVHNNGKRKLEYGTEGTVTLEQYNELSEQIQKLKLEVEAKDMELHARSEAEEGREKSYITLIHHLETCIEQNKAETRELEGKLREA
ncbi:hypothetical protein LINPERPRIM_LOCUS26182, partial [Linum perenne]